MAEGKIAPNLPDWMVEHPNDILLAAEPGSLQRNNKWHFDSTKLALSKNSIEGAGIDTCECASRKF